jgi:predicted nucleotidyltransferase
MSFDIEKHTIYLAKAGSHSYGTAMPESDLDFKGVAVPPRRYVLGFTKMFEQHEAKTQGATSNEDSKDIVIYGLQKFMKLAAACNPNFVEALYVEHGDVVGMSDEGFLLRRNRDLFISKKAEETFSGYALGQLHRIKTHRKWLLDPPKAAPTREQFGLSSNMKITPDMMGAFNKLETEGTAVSQNVMELVQNEKRYKAASEHWNQYTHWVKSRNPARAALEAKSGYDTKHAMHLVRLMRMCAEILVTGFVLVRRPDAEELLAIRRGAWSYDFLIAWAEAHHLKIKELAKASTLREEPDYGVLEGICIDILDRFWARNPD